MEKKITKKNYFEAIGVLAEGAEAITVSDGIVISGSELKDFAEKSIAQLEAKAAKAAETAAKKKAEGDDLRRTIQSVLTDDFQTINDILNKVVENFPEVTKAKITARMTQLVNAGVAEKEQVKLEDGRKVMAYRLNDKAEAEAAEE